MAQQQASLITDEMRAAVGRESEPVTFEVDKTACRMFARAVGYTDPIFYDEQYARAKGYRSVVAPPAFLGHPVITPGQPNPLAAAYFRFDTGLKRVLNGGTDIEYFDDVCAGDVLTATSQLVDIQEREGRLGPMLITITEFTYRNREGKVVAKARGTGIAY
ncbi:MAG: MaoC family dehydratase N-terminal domain-containing protein [Chloroflexi bacterium]|nr:MaoC family dehydratase N-terminal domain-containing protein [Chloroflexota bacterium]